METLIAIVGGGVGVLGLLIAWLTYKKTFMSEHKEEREHLIIQFRATQRLSRQVQDELNAYAILHDAYGKEIFPNVTYQAYINAMHDTYSYNLSEELLQKVSNEKLPKLILQSMTKSLESQFEALLQIQTSLKMISP